VVENVNERREPQVGGVIRALVADDIGQVVAVRGLVLQPVSRRDEPSIVKPPATSDPTRTRS
jgi:hypothetical protein